MHKYFIRTPWLVKRFFSSYTWDLYDGSQSVYLSFDDGPHPQITPWVLNLLDEYEAKASFFCIGKNVAMYPEVYRQIKDRGHAVGNHTYHHLNGWNTDDARYLEDIKAASELIHSSLFRPPYGRIKTKQAARVKSLDNDPLRIIMWDVLSGDFDNSFTPQDCFHNVARYVQSGSIIVFHDSEKAYSNLKFALPETLKFLKEAGYQMKKME